MTWRQKVLLQVGLLKLVMTLVAVAGYTTAVTCDDSVRQDLVWRSEGEGQAGTWLPVRVTPPVKVCPFPSCKAS